jgi:tRNA(Arg) A34 adenosine deaminase TadA
LLYATAEKEFYMRLALQEAKLAYEEGNLPIGAVVVLDGEVIARGRNQRYTGHFLRHAEMEALSQLPHPFNRQREQAALFTTVEPCIMCYGAILMANVAHVYFAACDRHAGASQIHGVGHYSRPRILTFEGGILEQASFDLIRQESEEHCRLLFGDRFEELCNHE